MSGIEKWAPEELWRVWNSEWQLIGQWAEKPRLSELAAAEGGGLTADYPNGRRDSWRVWGGELVEEHQFLKSRGGSSSSR